MQKVYLLFDALIKLLSYIPGHPGELSYLLLSFEQAVVGTLQVLQQGATNSVMLGDRWVTSLIWRSRSSSITNSELLMLREHANKTVI